jgi:adenine-specific DNA-methyltransferase
MSPFEKLQTKLKELFQLDQAADLDFGIYRIMNARREEITRFLAHDLLPQVREAFSQYQSSDKAEIQRELDQVIEGVRAGGMDPEASPRVQELRARLRDEAVDIAALENDVYSRLFDFFSRYYDEGDFISLRRYKDGVYAIPYEGEEVKLYWANHDQYYVKTAEHFRDYAFRTADDHRVHFKIVDADTEKDNIQASNGNERRFVLHGDDPVVEESGELIVRFEYCPDSQKRKQDAINAETATQVVEAVTEGGLSAWRDRLSAAGPTEKNPKRTVLEKHLYEYTRRNTFDYFIHKDLGTFLRHELSFYIKNEVMHLDDVENESAPRVEQYLSKIKVIRGIAHKIIAFLAQIEDFQKKLWLKKKFVVETNYCMTLDRVPEKFYAEIAANEAQREQWVRLFAIDQIKETTTGPAYSDPLTVEFLKAHPALVLDTAFFASDFKDRLLAAFDRLDEQIDGLLIHGENFQALSLLLAKYRKCVKCIHIDPPYNTETSGFLYKNDYRHSSWLAMMWDRLETSALMLMPEGCLVSHVDENEYERLKLVMDAIGIPDAGTIVWDKRNPMTAGRGVATQHEYIAWRSATEKPIYQPNSNVAWMLSTAEAIIARYGGVTEGARREYAAAVRDNPALSGGEKAYHSLDDDGRVYQSVSLRAPEPRTDPKFFEPLIHPLTGKPCAVPPNGFSRTPETLGAMLEAGEIIFGPDEKTQPRQKVLLTADTQMQVRSVIQNAKTGKQDLDELGLAFPYCHPVSLYEEIVGAGASGEADLVVDFFAGSGTTGHAVLNLNGRDGGRRGYILVEMADYFDTVLKPRIERVMFSREWKDGKPTSNGHSHAFKYLRLESYEDTLANIRLQRRETQQALLDESDAFRESYLLGYMLDAEAKGSASLLDLDRFEDPFKYELLIGTGSAGETEPVKVDLVETFNWLLGLRVRHMDHIRGFRVVEGTNPRGEKVLVIWRNLRQTSNEDLDEFFRSQQYNTLDMELALVYVNGDNNLMNLPMVPEGGEPPYKVRLVEEEFQRLMFDVKDVG